MPSELGIDTTAWHAAAHATGLAPVVAKPQPYLDLKAQFAPIRDEVMQAISSVMESQHFILGEEVRAFEEECASYLGAKHAIACASGSDALVLALMALEIGRDDEVITTPFSFFATGGSIARVGARPVFVDIDPATFNLDPAKIAAAITPQTKAIMPVHLFGLSADMDPVLALAKANGIAVVEDAAQAFGARYKGAAAGTIGNIGCFSFFPSKNLGGAGDGGLLTTEDATLADKLRILRVHGSRRKYHHELLGLNSRLDSLQAAILRVKLRHLAAWTAARQERAARYERLFDAAGLAGDVRVPGAISLDYFHVYNQFTLRCQDRDALRAFLTGRGIPTEIYYPVPLHHQPAFAYLGGQQSDLSVSEAVSREVLSVPVYPELTESQQEPIVGGIAEFYRAKN
jgi:dTDP-4-amino-4,6-dideoxygalactose transaminase